MFKSPAKRRRYVLDFLREHTELQQFGQPDSSKTWNGKTGCSFTVAQLNIGLWKNKFPSHNDLADIVGYPTERQRKGKIGLLSTQVLKIYRHYGMNFRLVRGWTWDRIETRAALWGPVHFYAWYTHQPEWRGAKYLGETADGDPNGFARPYGKAGGTQLKNQNFAHSELLAGYLEYRNKRGQIIHVTDIIRDPNHGSSLRPERPAFDKIYRTQGKELYESYAKMPQVKLGTAAIIPEDVFNGR